MSAFSRRKKLAQWRENERRLSAAVALAGDVVPALGRRLADTRHKIDIATGGGKVPLIVRVVPSLTELREAAERGCLWDQRAFSGYHFSEGGLRCNVTTHVIAIRNIVPGVTDRQARDLVKTDVCAVIRSGGTMRVYPGPRRGPSWSRAFVGFSIVDYVDAELRRRGHCSLGDPAVTGLSGCPICVFSKETKEALRRWSR